MTIDDQGSIVLFIPSNSEELTWLEDNTSAESWQWLGGSLAVDHHMAEALIEGVKDAGFEVKMIYMIVDTITNKNIESQDSERNAFRACVILNAHELHNGRSWRYAVSPPVEPVSFWELNLPMWAWQALTKVIEGR